MHQLSDFGWTDEFKQKWAKFDSQGMQPARVIADFGTSLKIALPDIHTAELTGKLAHHSNKDHAPKVGDWVAVHTSDHAYVVIEGVIPRRSEIARKVAGNRTVKQVIAANVDIAFVLLALDSDFSVERLKRFLYQLSANRITPVIVLNKADKTDDLDSYIEQLDVLHLPVIVTTATTGDGVESMLAFIKPGQTAILLGSSGVGKSTLTNQLLGRDAQKTSAVRASDATGTHTTVHRELFMLPNGGLLIDTPGIRELQLWGTEADLDENFDDIAKLMSQCKYTNCRHGDEAGCAIRQALQDGTLIASHYASYHKMKHELVNLREKTAVKNRQSNKKSAKNIARQARDDARDWRDQ